jgi:hypothetical protein
MNDPTPLLLCNIVSACFRIESLNAARMTAPACLFGSKTYDNASAWYINVPLLFVLYTLKSIKPLAPNMLVPAIDAPICLPSLSLASNKHLPIGFKKHITFLFNPHLFADVHCLMLNLPRTYVLLNADALASPLATEAKCFPTDTLSGA